MKPNIWGVTKYKVKRNEPMRLVLFPHLRREGQGEGEIDKEPGRVSNGYNPRRPPDSGRDPGREGEGECHEDLAGELNEYLYRGIILTWCSSVNGRGSPVK